MRIYLGDLTHYTVLVTNNHTPINIGFIAAFCKEKFKDQVEVKLFKDPRRLAAAMDENPPDILALSNYVWCQSVSEDMFKYYRKVKKDGISVWGGPNFPMNELHKAKQYLIDRPYVDFYIPFEGETPFYNIVKAVIEHGSDSYKLKNDHTQCFEGSFLINKDGELVGNKIGLQVEDINVIPSPYLTGLMDEFLKEGLHPMFETQRGCPYKCTFCHTGLDYYNRGRSFSLERIISEIEYITKTVPSPSKAHLYITDSNFGMWPQDLEFAKYLRTHYEKTGFPLSFGTSTGKGRVHLVLETVMTHPKLMLTNSVQSLDDGVLKGIKRRNLPLDQLKYSQAEIEEKGKLSQPEVILGLPLETRESHLATLRKLMVEIGADIIYQYTLMLLPGTEIYTDKLRKEHEYLVKYRLLPTSFGEYAGTRSFEIEEVSVGTKYLSHEDYLEMREMFFFVHNVHSNIIYRPVWRYILFLGLDVIDFFLYMMKKRKTMGEAFPNKVLSDYIRDTQEELFDSKEDLVKYYADDKNYAELLAGRKGINLTHTYRTIVMLHALEWADFITESFSEYIGENQPQVTDEMSRVMRSIIKNIKAQTECQYRFFRERDRIPSKENPLKVELDYDIPALFSKKLAKGEQLNIEESKVTYYYYMREEAIKYIASFPQEQRTIDLALIFLRMDRRYVFPLNFKETEALVSH